MTQALVKSSEELTTIERISQAGEQADTTIGIAVEWAKRLKHVIDEQHLFVEVKGKKHIIAEGWATMVALDHAGYESPADMIRELKNAKGETEGYLATTYIMKNGVRVAGASQACYYDDPPCRGKEGGSKDRAAISTAQTWAGVKAGRMHYGWIVVMAGYAATPAEEMTNDKVEEQDKSAHWCQVHQTNWFKRGRMSGFAHKIEGIEEWCNELTITPTEGQKHLPSSPASKTEQTPIKQPAIPQQTTSGADNDVAASTIIPKITNSKTDIDSPTAFWKWVGSVGKGAPDVGKVIGGQKTVAEYLTKATFNDLKAECMALWQIPA